MTITSFEFAFFMLPVLMLYYLLPFVFWKKCILFSAGILFYLSFVPVSLFYLGAVIIYVYLLGLLIEKYRKGWILFCGLSVVVAGLCYFKYSNFLTEILGPYILIHVERFDLAVPLGISFFTFKSLGYLVDVYQQKYKAEKSLLNLGLYISFFPQISSGPIQKANSFLSQINQNRKFNPDLTSHGILLIFFGVFEKMVIADRLYLLVQSCFKEMSTLTPSLALIGVVAYAFQIYSDFDSYSNMAIGLTELFGYNCEKNFNVPYLSKTMKEFWGRWHISLSSWLKEYIYFPLGGNRQGTLRKYLNLMIVFLISGLWHGAARNYVLWGFLNGAVQILYDLTFGALLRKVQIKNRVLNIAGSLVMILMNFCVICCLWVFFRFDNLEDIRQVFVQLSFLDFSSISFAVPEMEMMDVFATVVFVLLLVICDILRNTGFTLRHYMKIPFIFRWALSAVLIVLLLVFAVYGPGYDASKFIYLEF